MITLVEDLERTDQQVLVVQVSVLVGTQRYLLAELEIQRIVFRNLIGLPDTFQQAPGVTEFIQVF